jgi:hypothetical protein
MVEQSRGSLGDDPEQTPGGARYLFARFGPFLCALIGVLTMVVGAALAFVGTGELIAMLVIGAAVGGFVGSLIQTDARARLGESAAKPQVARPAPAKPVRAADRKRVPAAKVQGHGLRPDGPWARSYQACARSVASFYAVVDSLPEGAGRTWMAEIGGTLDRELAEALRLARLGENLSPDGQAEPNESARRVLDRLHAAEKSFAETTDRAVEIALDLRDESDFVRVRTQLDLLAEQARHLLAADGGRLDP